MRLILHESRLNDVYHVVWIVPDIWGGIGGVGGGGVVVVIVRRRDDDGADTTRRRPPKRALEGFHHVRHSRQCPEWGRVQRRRGQQDGVHGSGMMFEDILQSLVSGKVQ